MAEPIWLIGPAGYMQPFPCPETDVEISTIRYGGIHQGLSGATSLDVTGHRQQFTFDFKYLEQTEYSWLEMLHLRHLRGPFRLISPLKVNRLSPEASSGKVAPGTAYGAYISAGATNRVYDWPVAAGVGLESTVWTNRPVGTSVLRFDDKKKSTVQVGEVIVGSLYAKASSSMAASLVIDWFDRSGTQVGGLTPVAMSMTTSWQRFQVTGTVPAGAYSCRLAAYTATNAPDITFAAAQLELGSTPTAWSLGGGAPVVVIDQLSTTSPYFPLTSCQMTILET